MTINYSKQVLLKRGNSAVSSTYVGPLGEVTVDTDFATIRVHDGVTPGGHLSTSSASGATPPPNPRESSIWYDTVGGRLYVYYDGAWVDASPSGDLFLAANVANLSVLVTGLTSDVANVETHIDSLDANIGAFETAFSANIGAFETAFSANIGAFETAVNVTVGTLNANINTLNQTIAAFESNVGPTSDAWVDDAPPDISNVGALWYDDISGRLYVYYDGAWVDANPPITTGFGNVLPSANVTYSLGSEQYQWKDLWVSSNTIYIGNTPITVSNGSLSVAGNVVSGGAADLGKFKIDTGGGVAFLATTDDADGWGGYDISINPSNEGSAYINIPNNANAELGDALTINSFEANSSVQIRTDWADPWIFGANGVLVAPDDIIAGSVGSGGRFVQDCDIGTTSMRWINMPIDSDQELIRAYSDSGNSNAERAQIRTNWLDNDRSGLTLRAFDRTNANSTIRHNWIFQGDGNLTLPPGGDILDSNGASVLGGGGAADTGNIVFSGASIGLDAGTEDAADTYINISPNAEGWAFLQLPNDTSANTANTRLWNAAGNVEIGTGDFSNLGPSYTWNFNKDGSLTFPGGNITIASNITGSGLDAMLGSANAAVGIIAQGELGSIGIQWNDTGVDVGLGSNIAGVVVNSPAGSTPGTVQIQTGVIGSLYTWEFGAEGVTTFPNGLNFGFMGEVYMNGGTAVFGSAEYDTNIVANASGIAQEFNFGTDGSLTMPNGAKIGSSDAYKFATDNTVVTALDIRDTSERGFYTDGNGYTLRSSEEKNWGFGTTGILTLPSNSYVETTDANLKVGSQGNVTIRANAATVGGTRAWTFDTNGVLTFPNSGVINGANIVIPSSGSITFANGVNILSTVGNYGNTNVAAYLAGNVTVGNLLLTSGGEITTAAGTGNVVIEANDGVSRIWEFSSNAALIFPDSTVQTTAYVAANNVSRVTGSWTVTTGSANYDFTVPTNGTYIMWVRGNIPNGIIAWNATATVMNNNVPVVGQQFAWNYDAVIPMPLEITALPVQFIGTANTIINANTYGGGPSNTFTFTVNNASGSSQTVYWGYVAQ